MGERVEFVTLPDGRRIAYTQLGCTSDTAQRSLIALHGLMSSRLAAMPGVSEDTLKEFGVRLVAIDRPGYGQSDPHPSQTFYSFSKDIEAIVDALKLGKRIWLLGFSMGGAFCWAAARYIPDRIAGIALWSPVGNFGWKGISKDDLNVMLGNYSRMDRVLFKISKRLPFFAFKWYAKSLSANLAGGPSGDASKGLSPEDWKCLEQPGVGDQMSRDYTESVSHSKGFGVAKDLQLMSKKWGFEITQIGKVFKGKIHIWQGDQDRLVPLRMQQWVHKQLPEMIQLHELPGEGHISWVCFNDAAHRETLRTLFEDGGDSG